ncbi:hypothetical protein Smp_182360 [Schistosoma mansoni]|uniref:hypothetical protein n=1 Tax=Schistosoma mansoni TaxID=6183 RepID=UPI00022C85A0|nr:hypothetical protein Smp_182360 [Schistosoma mansoni]|eukprot:XP_018644517.1 hypothetical protein Smp_182360 [Schistosoma mansoni]
MSSGFVDYLVMLMVMMMNQLLRDRHVNLDNLSSLGTSLISFSAVCIHDTASPDSKTALIIFVRKLRTSRTLSRHPTVFISIFNRSTIFTDISTNIFSEIFFKTNRFNCTGLCFSPELQEIPVEISH